MQSFPQEVLCHLVGIVDRADVASLANSCMWMCRVCRLVHGRRLQLSGDQGRELFVLPSGRTFSSCRRLQYQLWHSSLESDAFSLQLAVAFAALNMPHTQEVRILLLGDAPNAVTDAAQRKAVDSCIRALQRLPSLHKLSCSFHSSMYGAGLRSLFMLTALTALQLEADEPFELPAAVAQLSQLRQLQLSGATLPQLEEGTVPSPHLPSSLTGLTFLARLGGWEWPWAWQLQLSGDTIRSLEVQLHPQACSDEVLLLNDLGIVAGMTEVADQPVLPHLTRLVFRAVCCSEYAVITLALREQEQSKTLFPALQCFQIFHTYENSDVGLSHDALTNLSACRRQLQELSWVGGACYDNSALPVDLVFEQLTSLKMRRFISLAGDGQHDDIIVDWLGEEAPGSSSVIHAMFPALQDLTVRWCEVLDTDLMRAAAAGLARCTGITRLVLCVTSESDYMSVEWLNIVASGLSRLQRLELVLDACALDSAALMASWPAEAVAGLAAFTQVWTLRLASAPFERGTGQHDNKWDKRCADKAAAQTEAASNMQLALGRLVRLHNLKQLELCNIAGVSALLLATLTAQLPVLQLLQLEGCSEGPDESEQQWHTAEAAAASSSGAAGGLEGGGMWSRLQQVRAGLRPGVKLVVQPSSWPTNSNLYW